MYRKMTLSVVLVAGCVWCVVLAKTADSQTIPGAGPFKPAASLHALMHGQDVFYKEIDANLKKPVSKRTANKIETAAELLAELSNVNLRHKEEMDYRSWASEIRDTALMLSKEASKRDAADAERMKAMFETIKKTCGDCHDAYH